MERGVPHEEESVSGSPSLVGACAAETILAATTIAETEAVVKVDGGELRLRDVQISGGSGYGLIAQSSTVDVDGVGFVGSALRPSDSYSDLDARHHARAFPIRNKLCRWGTARAQKLAVAPRAFRHAACIATGMLRLRALLCMAAFATFAPNIANAVGTSDLGESHRLIGRTKVMLRTDTPLEEVRLTLAVDDEKSFIANITSPYGTLHHEVVDGSALLSYSGEVGTWQVSFEFPEPGQLDRISFDAEVVDTATGAPLTGRMWSKVWEFDAGSFMAVTNRAFYVAIPQAEGYAVWRLGLGGLAGYEFIVSGNSTGLSPPYSGLSAPMAEASFIAQHDVYLELPDVDVAPPSDGVLEAEILGNGSLRVDTDGPGTVRLIADLDGDGIFPSSAAENLAVRVTQGTAPVTIPIPTVDGEGVTLSEGSYYAQVIFRPAEFHFAALDVEFCRPGVRIHRVTRDGVVPSSMRWDDTLINDGTLSPVRSGPGGVSSADVDAPSVPGVNAHAWGGPLGSSGGPGNLTVIDTWTADEEISATVIITVGGDDVGVGVVFAPDAGPAPGEDAGVAEAPDGGAMTDGSIDAGTAEPTDGGSAADAGRVDAGPPQGPPDGGLVETADGGFVVDGGSREDDSIVDAGTTDGGHPFDLADAGVPPSQGDDLPVITVGSGDAPDALPFDLKDFEGLDDVDGTVGLAGGGGVDSVGCASVRNASPTDGLWLATFILFGLVRRRRVSMEEPS